jgi:hypothetical protein
MGRALEADSISNVRLGLEDQARLSNPLPRRNEIQDQRKERTNLSQMLRLRCLQSSWKLSSVKSRKSLVGWMGGTIDWDTVVVQGGM